MLCRRARSTPPLSVSFTFDGLGNDDNNALTGFVVNPPDVSGDVGPSHYVETLNTILAVYNRSGAKVLGPVLLKSLWQGFAGSPPCKTHNDGDPVVLYDQISNRWVITQFSLQFFSDHVVTDECVAVSKNGDPTGAYWIYDFAISPTLFADYPKLGVWPDGYYLTFNDFADNGPSYSFVGVSAVVLQRSKMLSGASRSPGSSTPRIRRTRRSRCFPRITTGAGCRRARRRT